MKITGIVRRIDDLGRVVIPKAIRQSLGIREGDPLEIFVENGNVVFQKYKVRNIDWHSVYEIVAAVVPSEVRFALYDSDLKCQITQSDKFAADGNTIDSVFLATILDKDTGEVYGYIAFDKEEYEPSVAVGVARAFIKSTLEG